MSFLESIQNRYTTKKYNPSKKIDPSKIDELKNILRLSPSSINSQPWRFTYISDNDKRKQLSEISVSAKRSWQLLLTIAVLAFVEQSSYRRNLANLSATIRDNLHAQIKNTRIDSNLRTLINL